MQLNSLSISRNLRAGIALAVTLLFSTGAPQAASVIDSFNNISAPFSITNSTPVGLLTALANAGGVGFTSGYQQPSGSVPVFKTNDLSLPLTNYVAGQSNSVNHWSIGAQISTSVRRVATRDVTPLSGTIWFSFIGCLLTPAGDLALTFNGTLSGTGQFGAGDGMRVGLGLPALPGAFGIGPVGSQATLATINNGVNGAITTSGFLPVDGTPGLVLGRIYTDSGTGFRRVDIWYNPDVASAAALPAPVLSFTDTLGTIVPGTVTKIGYQVVRASAANELIDNVKLSDEPNGFEIVYKNAPLPLPALTITALPGTEFGPSNAVFSITSDRVLTAPLTLTYRPSGVATNGYDGVGFSGADYTDTNFNTGILAGLVTMAAGTTNAKINILVIDDAIPEGDETLVLTFDSSPDYLLGSSSASTVIYDNNDANASAQYMFSQTALPQVWDTNLVLSAMGYAGVSGGFSGTDGYFISPPASLRARGDSTAVDAAGALANGDFFSFSVSPAPGYAVTITNLQLMALYANYLFQEPGAAAAVIFVRSSLDGYSSDLASWTLQPDSVVYPAWYALELPLNDSFKNLPGGVEFRFYVYDDTTQNQVGVRIDDVFVRASTAPAQGVQQVTISGSTHAAEPAIPGSVVVTRYGATSNALTVFYSLGGEALQGVDYATLGGSIVIPAGETQAAVSIVPIDDWVIEPDETIILTLLADPAYSVLAPMQATVLMADDGDVGGIVGYLFNEGNNDAGSLAAAAKAVVTTPGVIASNAAAGPGLGGFGANSTAVGHGYASSSPHSPPSALFMRGDALTLSADDAFAADDYVSFTLRPASGYTLTITNLTAFVKLTATGQTTWAFLRSSTDNFTANISAIELPGVTTEQPYFYWVAPIAAVAATDPTEFRMYFYASRLNGGDITRVDDVSFQGYATSTVVAPVISSVRLDGGHVVIQFTGESADQPGAFELRSSAAVDGAFAKEGAAQITGAGGVFQATVAPNGPVRFYRIVRP